MAELVLVVLAVCAVRVALMWRFVAYSHADETTYKNVCEVLALSRFSCYRAIVRDYEAHSQCWQQPPPSRPLFLFLGALFVKAFGAKCRSIAWLSTCSSVVAVVATAWFVWLLRGSGAALAAALLVGTSPLLVGVGRRALNDSPVLAAQALAIVAVAYGPGAWPWLMAALVGVLLLKDGAIFSLPALFGLTCWLWQPWFGSGLVFAGSFAAWWLILFAAMGREPLTFLRKIGPAGLNTEYSARHGHGGAFRLVIDLFLAAPLVVLGATGGDWVFVAAAAAVLAAFHLAPAQNIRFALLADLLLRVSVAVVAPWWALVVYAAADLVIGYRLVWRGKMYDPITANLLGMLGVVR